MAAPLRGARLGAEPDGRERTTSCGRPADAAPDDVDEAVQQRRGERAGERALRALDKVLVAAVVLAGARVRGVVLLLRRLVDRLARATVRRGAGAPGSRRSARDDLPPRA